MPTLTNCFPILQILHQRLMRPNMITVEFWISCEDFSIGCRWVLLFQVTTGNGNFFLISLKDWYCKVKPKLIWYIESSSILILFCFLFILMISLIDWISNALAYIQYFIMVILWNLNDRIYWLFGICFFQNVAREGSFKPWLDSSCLSTLPPVPLKASTSV